MKLPRTAWLVYLTWACIIVGFVLFPVGFGDPKPGTEPGVVYAVLAILDRIMVLLSPLMMIATATSAIVDGVRWLVKRRKNSANPVHLQKT